MTKSEIIQDLRLTRIERDIERKTSACLEEMVELQQQKLREQDAAIANLLAMVEYLLPIAEAATAQQEAQQPKRATVDISVDKARALEMHKQDMSYAAIGKELGRSKQAIHKWLNPKSPHKATVTRIH